MPIIKIILAILLPPLAAYMQVGLTKYFWVSLLLSFFFFVPGVLFTLWLVLTEQKG